MRQVFTAASACVGGVGFTTTIATDFRLDAKVLASKVAHVVISGIIRGSSVDAYQSKLVPDLIEWRVAAKRLATDRYSVAVRMTVRRLPAEQRRVFAMIATAGRTSVSSAAERARLRRQYDRWSGQPRDGEPSLKGPPKRPEHPDAPRKGADIPDLAAISFSTHRMPQPRSV
jgi:hypothetical protein